MNIQEIANDIYKLTEIDINVSIEEIYSLEGDEPYYCELQKYYRIISEIQSQCKHENVKKNRLGETVCANCMAFISSL